MDGVHLIHAHHFLEATVEGALDVERGREILVALAHANEPKHYNLLIDLRPAHGGERLSFADVFRLVGVLEDHPGAFGGNRIALLDEYDAQFEKTQFFEATATHRGFQVRAFLDAGAAARWVAAAPRPGLAGGPAPEALPERPA